MGWSRIGGDVFLGAGANGGSNASGFDTSGADTLFVVEGTYIGGTLQTIRDNYSNTWYGLTAVTDSGEPRLRLWYAKNAIVGPNHIVTSDGSTSYSSFSFDAWAGGDLTAPFDQEAGLATSPTSAAFSNFTPFNLAANDELVIAGAVSFNTGTVTSVDTGFTIRNQSPYQAGTNEGSCLATKVLSGGGGSTTSATANLSGLALTGICLIGTFKAATGGATATFDTLLMMGV